MISNALKVTIRAKHANNAARVLDIITPHGQFESPIFMPVGTRAAVNCMTIKDLETVGAQVILGGNTYHMLISPGTERIAELGGMHKFMGWSKPMLIDSGGFQVFSLSKTKKNCKIDADGVSFTHPNTGQIIYLNPQVSIQTQKILGADMVMAFDHCTPDSDNKVYVANAMQTTHRWLEQSMTTHKANPYSKYGFEQAFFGIIQGAYFKDLRRESTRFILDQNTDGIALGGETIGYNMPKTLEILDWICPLLPVEKPLYTMGVGSNPQDLIDVVAGGADLFDCVAPTRNARHGRLYVGQIRRHQDWIRFESKFKNKAINLHNARFCIDNEPIMPTCTCYTCHNHSAAYLRFLLKSQSPLYLNLASIHNVQVMLDTCAALRKCIINSQTES